jgi:hypothetical protein
MSDRIEHSREEWDHIDAERRKAEDEAYAKRKAQEGLVSVPAKFITRNEFGFLPEDEPAVEAKVKYLLTQHHELELMPWKMLERAWAIGMELIALKRESLSRTLDKVLRRNLVRDVGQKN